MATDSEDGAGVEAATTLGIDRTATGRAGHFGPDVIRAMEQVIVGQRYMLERLLVGLLANGHVLLEGVPGLAKTLAVTSLAQALHARYQRIQFTPDLLPADLIGTLIYKPQSGEFRVRKGPVFANLLLADEINRAPAKVQSALLEAMQESQVTIGDETYRAAAAVPRARDAEPDRAGGHLSAARGAGRPLHAQAQGRLPGPRRGARDPRAHGAHHAAAADRAGRRDRAGAARAPAGRPRLRRRQDQGLHRRPRVRDARARARTASSSRRCIDFGASPRASIYLALAAKAYAFLQGRGYVTPQDVKSIGMDVLRHRVLTTYEAEAEGVTAEDLIQQVFDNVARALSAGRRDADRRDARARSGASRSARGAWSTACFAGEYHSVFKGRGMEFAEVREYVPGDDVRTIDWNVTARMGQPLRQAATSRSAS